jgi:hypothetical protein
VVVGVVIGVVVGEDVEPGVTIGVVPGVVLVAAQLYIVGMRTTTIRQILSKIAVLSLKNLFTFSSYLFA